MSKPPAVVHAERRIQDLLGGIHHDTTSLTHLLVKAHRSGMAAESGRKAATLLHEAVDAMLASYETAIAQPENKVPSRPTVDL